MKGKKQAQLGNKKLENMYVHRLCEDDALN